VVWKKKEINKLINEKEKEKKRNFYLQILVLKRKKKRKEMSFIKFVYSMVIEKLDEISLTQIV
jgi:hypothetical protein